jgi:hypothetical protein
VLAGTAADLVQGRCGTPLRFVSPLDLRSTLDNLSRIELHACRIVRMARSPDDFEHDPAGIVANPEVEVTPELFLAWLDRVQQGEPFDPGIRAADTLAEIREHGED